VGSDTSDHSIGSEEKRARSLSLLARSEWVLAILLTAVVLFLLNVRVTHVGGLWRDECESVQLVQMPRLADVFGHVGYSSFPVLFTVVLKAYIALFGDSDLALRAFGYAVGVAFIITAWFHSLRTSLEPPLLLLALVGLNSNFLVVGTWVRGYGIGAVLIVLAFILTGKLLREPHKHGLLTVALALVAATQSLFFNLPLAAAFLSAALAVFLVNRQFRPAVGLVAIGMVICVAYLPYIFERIAHFGQARRWAVEKQNALFWSLLLGAFGRPGSVMPFVWSVLVIGCITAAVFRLKRIWNRELTTERDLLLFGTLVIIVSIPVYWGFVSNLNKPALSRYLLSFVYVLAAALDLLLARLCRLFPVRLVRVTTVGILMMTLPFAVWPTLLTRATNIDILAKQLQKDAGPEDLILVNTWSRGISFNRYFHGQTRWMTVPNIQEHRFHCYDLVQAKMAEFFPLDDLEQAIAATLKSQNRVWLVNDTKRPENLPTPLVLTPAPDPQYGWHDAMYSLFWSDQLDAFLRRRAEKVQPILPRMEGVEALENAELALAQGWQY
jgi:hypothetical protein